MNVGASDLARAVTAEVDALQRRLLAAVEANLSGGVLQTRSGALKASIVASISGDVDTVRAIVTSEGVPYASIQEDGGQTAPHEIVPVKARALALAGGGFARRVQHPGSAIPAHRYLGGALDAMRDEIAVGIKTAVRDALGVG